MNALKSTVAVALALCGLGAASAGHAASLDIQYVQTSGVVLSTSRSDDYLTGGMEYLDVAGHSFEAFCVELAQGHASATAGFQRFTVGGFSGQQASLLQGLFSSSYAGLNGATEKAAFQTALWEITHETSGVLNASDGSFHFDWLSLDSTAAEDAAFLAMTSGYLQAAAAYAGPARYTLTRLSSGAYQDLLTASAVPEPESYALLLAGLGVVGFVAGRRRQAR
ncbi:PEP-CTERM sorting domain-containing protein [Roseateles violae]|uniref:PEP-CTERM sorting domain-containing protein n=1 Tax=Roseateles violae TaxID=3058042 RepID=A0ABT8DXF3_9BURK|nr:PEP-CTERM sorting domain-containing protein [Pelomonas sp. PFR6]MDN3922123.1 PEP-CTERM sorting domain-containing protein [Pelomonas sp. PFR6]